MPSRLSALETDVVLRDGATLHLRPARETDRAALDTLGRRLAAEGWPDDVSAMVPAGQAFILIGESGGTIGAVASYTPTAAAPDRASVTFAMERALEGRGIGTAMLEMLARIAWDRGIRTFDADVRRNDDALMRMFVGSGFEIEQRTDAATCQVTLSLEHTQDYADRAAARSEAAATASVKAFLEPRSVAVVGASPTRGKIGAEVLQNLLADGYTGRLFAVHPSAREIGGVPAVPRVTDVPGDLDLVVIAVPARLVLAVVEDCIAKRVKALLVITAGFGETGSAGRALEADLVTRIRRAGMRMVGPNCMGLINTDPAIRLNATFAPVSPPAGGVAMSTQSGALGLAILDYARELNIGLSTFVSIGNKADVSTNDLLQYWAQDARTSVILIYVESFGNPRKFSQIARRVARRKPIVAVKAGRSASGARAATSHTGALAARDDIVDALFRQAGVIRTDTLEELFDVAMVLAQQPVPRGRRVAVLTNAGGPGILAADACEALGLMLPALGDASVAALRALLPAEASVANPIDMIASATAAQYEQALGTVLSDERVDSVLVIFIPPLVTKTEDVAKAVQRAVAAHPGKPVLGIFMSARGAGSLIAPIPCFRFPESAVAALARAAAYGEWLATPEPEAAAPPAGGDRDAAHAVVQQALERGGGWLRPVETAALVAAMGLPAAESETASTGRRSGTCRRSAGLPRRPQGHRPSPRAQDRCRRRRARPRGCRGRACRLARSPHAVVRSHVGRARAGHGDRRRRDARRRRRGRHVWTGDRVRDGRHTGRTAGRQPDPAASGQRARGRGDDRRAARGRAAPRIPRRAGRRRGRAPGRAPAPVDAGGLVPGDSGIRNQPADRADEGRASRRCPSAGRTRRAPGGDPTREVLTPYTTFTSTVFAVFSGMASGIVTSSTPFLKVA